MLPVLAKLSVFLTCISIPLAATQAGIMFNVNQQMGSSALDTIVLVEQQATSLKFTITVDDSVTGNIGDLRGIFFHVADESLLGGLSGLGTDVTGQAYSANNVSNLGNGANVNGSLSPFDAGIKIGTSGIGANDIRTTMFVLSHSTQSLDLNSFFKLSTGPSDYVMAIRATSVGIEGGNRDGSSKTAILGPTTTTTGGHAPEPGTAAIWMTSALICVVARNRRKV